MKPSVYFFVSDFFCSNYGLGLFNHISASINRSFLLLWSIPLCDHSTIYLFTPQLLAIWVISSLGLLWTVLLRNCCTSLLIFWWIYVLITYIVVFLEVRWLDCIVVECSTSADIAKEFSKLDAHWHAFQQFQSLCVLISIWYF